MRQQQAPFVNRRVDFTTPGFVPPVPLPPTRWVHDFDDEPCDDPDDTALGEPCGHGFRVREVWR